MLKNKKIISLDVGAQGGFNSDNFFPSRYNIFLKIYWLNQLKSEADKLNAKNFIINKGLWSKKEKKKLYILDNRLGSSSMYMPNEDALDLHNINRKNFKNYQSY